VSRVSAQIEVRYDPPGPGGLVDTPSEPKGRSPDAAPRTTPNPSLEAWARLDEQLRLASQVQRDLLPHPLPTSSTARFHVLYLPADHVSGDIYDIVRLDESNLAISLADATGHGIPAALLTVLIKRSFRSKVIEAGSYRILEPDEVLANLNRELLEMNLSHCQFVTAAQAIWEESRRELRWARGGLPYPVMVRRGIAGLVASTGVLLGAVETPPLAIVRQRLVPGDRVYFYTDGLEALLCRKPSGENPFDITRTPWFDTLAGRSPEQALAELGRLRGTTPAGAWPRDDITVVCLECIA